eukprot:scaffold483315_cov29-Prasinocladus_malaysianus.AAC.1
MLASTPVHMHDEVDGVRRASCKKQLKRSVGQQLKQQLIVARTLFVMPPWQSERQYIFVCL